MAAPTRRTEDPAMRTAEITFTPERPAEAAALIADLEHVSGPKERRGHSHVLNLQPTPERKGLFRRAEPVPSAAVFRSDRWFSVVVGTLDAMQVGSLSNDLAANGFAAPSHWELGADVSNMAGWRVPFDEQPEQLVSTALAALQALPGGTGRAATYDAELEHRRPASTYNP